MEWQRRASAQAGRASICASHRRWSFCGRSRPVRKVTAKTSAERQQALRLRRTDAGLKQIRNLWCHPDDEAAIREHADKRARKRAKPARREER